MKITKERLKQIIKEEFESVLEQEEEMEEGYRGSLYRRRPDLRPDYKGTGGSHPDYPPKPEDPEKTLKVMLDVLMMSNAGVRIDDFERLREMAIEKGMSPEEAEQRIQPRR